MPPRADNANRVEPGSSRGIAGIAGAVAGATAALSAFAPWGIASISDGAGAAQFSLNGFGQLSYQPSMGADSPGARELAEALTSVMSAPGQAAFLPGAVGCVAALAYLSSAKRTAAAVVMIGFGLLSTVLSLSQLGNVRGMFNNASDLAGAQFAPGPGVFTAIVAALALTGLGAAALVLERQALARSNGVPVPLQAGTPTQANATPTMADGPGLAMYPTAPREPRSAIPGAPAGIWTRVIAGGVDVVLVAVFTSALAAFTATIGRAVTTSEFARVVWVLLSVLLVAPVPLAYFALLETRTGRTVGKRLTGIEVQGPHGWAPSLRESLRRNAVHILLGVGLAFGLGPSVLLTSEIGMPLTILAAFLPTAYAVGLLSITISVFSNDSTNPWRLGVHDRWAQGPTRVVNQSGAPPAPTGAESLTSWWAVPVVLMLLLGLTGVVDAVRASMGRVDSAPLSSAPTATHTVTVERSASPEPIPPVPTSSRRSPGASTFPADGTLCPPRYGSTGAYTESAVGNDHTSCPFAEEVRLAYADMPPGSMQRLIVTSPVTNTPIDMMCGQAVGGFVVCRGGDDAVVYLN